VPVNYTIGELAEKSNLSVRNIRAYQSRGLVSPPTMRGRVGYYDGRHLAQLRMVTQLQGEGFNLAAIKKVSESTYGADVIWADLTPEAQAVLADRPESVEMFCANGVLRLGADGTLQGLVAHRPLFWDLVGEGLPVEEIINLLEEVTRTSNGVAANYAAHIRVAVTQVAEQSEDPDSQPNLDALITATVRLLTSFFGTSVGYHTVADEPLADRNFALSGSAVGPRGSVADMTEEQLLEGFGDQDEQS